MKNINVFEIVWASLCLCVMKQVVLSKYKSWKKAESQVNLEKLTAAVTEQQITDVFLYICYYNIPCDRSYVIFQ